MNWCVGAPSGHFMVLWFGSRSEITELTGSNGVDTFRTQLEFVSRYLVSIRTRCSPRPPRRGIKISRCLPSYLNIIKQRRRDLINISFYAIKIFITLTCLYFKTLSLPRQSPSTIKIIGLSYLARLWDRLPPNRDVADGWLSGRYP